VKSDLSGDPLEGTHEPTSIKVKFPDGDEREATVTFEEAQRLRGRPVPPPPPSGRLARFGAWIGRNAWKLVAALIATWFASIVIPALVLQWSDRQKELDLKNALVTGISTSVGDTLEGAWLVERSLTPEANAAANKRADWRSEQKKAENPKSPGGVTRTLGEQKLIDDDRTAYIVARESKRKVERKLTNDTHKAWIKTGASIEARLATYFPHEALAKLWNDYHTVVLDYLTLATQVGRLEKDAESSVLAYVCQEPASKPPPGTPRFPTQAADVPVCPKKHNASANPITVEIVFPFKWAFYELLRRRVPLLTDIRDANAEGYSTTRKEFMNDVTFGLWDHVA
jgi:hypothetical protein